MFNFVVKLSEIRDWEGKILKKQLKLICLLSTNLLKAEGNSLKAEGFEIMKKIRDGKNCNSS